MANTPNSSEPLTATTQMSEGMRDMLQFAGRAAANGAEQFAEESFRFWSRRMNAYADHLSALQNCQSAQDIFALNGKFLSKTMTDYADEARAVIELGKKQKSGAAATTNRSQAA